MVQSEVSSFTGALIEGGRAGGQVRRVNEPTMTTLLKYADAKKTKK